jgi:proteasome lid subunit RPN8/RPN11
MIRLTRGQLAQIETAAEAAYPAADRNDRFEVDPQVHIDLIRALRGTPEGVVGHYHSHPDHPAAPSPRDLEAAIDGSMIWLVTAVRGGRAGETTAHRLNAARDAFVAIQLEVIDET